MEWVRRYKARVVEVKEIQDSKPPRVQHVLALNQEGHSISMITDLLELPIFEPIYVELKIIRK